MRKSIFAGEEEDGGRKSKLAKASARTGRKKYAINSRVFILDAYYARPSLSLSFIFPAHAGAIICYYFSLGVISHPVHTAVAIMALSRE